jgi:predicted metal-dependent HD superfamily phosphohydrolase
VLRPEDARNTPGAAPDRAGGDLPATQGVDDGATRFAAVWQRCVASPPSPDAAAVYADLARLYTAPYRRYHNLTHIQDCLLRLDEVAPLLVDRDAVEFGLWFHDAVYDVGSMSNEWRSAELFLQVSAGASFAFRHRVCAHILATRHVGTVHGNDRRFIVDIDLSGFGATWEEFMRNGALLREESSAQSDAKYHTGQVAFLTSLQRRPHFFTTDYFRDRYETIARENLRRLLDDLRAQGYGSVSPPIL